MVVGAAFAMYGRPKAPAALNARELRSTERRVRMVISVSLPAAAANPLGPNRLSCREDCRGAARPAQTLTLGEAEDLFYACVIGYFAKISSIRLKALSAAACGAMPSFMMSTQPTAQTC